MFRNSALISYHAIEIWLLRIIEFVATTLGHHKGMEPVK